MLKKNDCGVKEKLLEAYKGLVFNDIENKGMTYTIYGEDIGFEKGGKSGWDMLADPQ